MTDPRLAEEIAASLPDTPRWLEARGLLLSGSCRIEGPADGCVILHVRQPVAALAGHPTPGLLRETLGRVTKDFEIGFQEEHLDLLTTALPEWTVFPGIVYTLDPGARAWESIPTDGVRLLRKDEKDLIESIPLPGFRVPLQISLETMAVAARFIGGAPVSFCGVNAETESLWDVAVFTLEEHRRQGYSAACCGLLIDHMMDRGKAPVWGTVEENVASRREAERLGFVPAERTYAAIPEKPPAMRRRCM